jgi:phosphoribosylanthranilate isomerase
MTPTRTRVKVCGITTPGDARVAVAAGADWIGVVLDGDGPRRVALERAREIARAAPAGAVVAVMVAPSDPGLALARAHEAGAARLQLHRVDPQAWPDDFPLPLTIAVAVGDDGRLLGPLPRPAHTLLLDHADPHRPGGTGRTFPWEAARAVAAARPVVLAGGLGPDNVADAIAAVRPYAVDASSRLEGAPGVKDPDRVRRFVAAAREADERLAAG